MKTNNPQEAASNIFKKMYVNQKRRKKYIFLRNLFLRNSNTISKGKSDNISIVVIFLRHPKHWSQFEPKKPGLPTGIFPFQVYRRFLNVYNYLHH